MTWPAKRQWQRQIQRQWQRQVSDLWHLRHWIQFWQLRNWIHDKLCFLTIKSDTGQHSQFLRCFACQSWPFSRNKTLHRSQNMWFPSLRAAPFSRWQTSHWIVGLGPLIFLFFLWFLLANNPLEGTETCRFVLVCLIKRFFQLLITIFFDVGIYLHGTHVGRCVDAWPDQHTIYDKDHKDWCGDDASPLILIQMSTRTGVTEDRGDWGWPWSRGQ